MTTECLIRRTDDELQIVYGEVYAPNVPDVHGEFMTPVEVRKMAHRFMEKQSLDVVDTNHDNQKNASHIVESWVLAEDESDSIYLPGAWVIGMHVPDPEVWQSIKKGEINGFSLEALVHLKEQVIEIDIPDRVHGVTAEANGHTHGFEVRFDVEGNFLGGAARTEDGHSHEILRGTVTEEANGHTHRYSIMEQVQVVDSRAA